ncbi:DNA primase [Bdellovibrio svalbardensis]|uniref:DNA primase n=1 Tax=Bdellovibrio svalbardensis TaxID=2972972 RepID=A0ABT6DFK6_9BACT|nr:DNA primase [Bdellovibrio svalbardensis]MDG0814729.1 DNA primase [Bdellovibrio svalbardensis]
MRFSQDFIEKVSEANNLVDLISQYTQLKPSGSGLMGRCPFPDHAEKTASFSVSETKQVYHCFGCHKSGNMFSFLRDYQGMNFPEAVEYLANRASIPIPAPENDDPNRDQLADKKKALLKVNKVAADYFSDQLKRVSNDHPVKKYIASRGLTQEVIETFGIGYAIAEWDGLERHLQGKQISMTLAEEARLVKARNGKPGYFDLFRDRLMFPIFSPMGEPIAFGGRYLEKKETEPKYLNSPETPVFIKGKVLYGLSQTAKYIRSEDMALIVEGYMDLVSLYQAGIRNSVATMGTALTPDHGRMLKRMTKNVVALFDGDSAGMEAAERSLPILLAADLYPKGLTLPNNMDPDDYVKKYGAEALKIELERAPDLFVMILARWMEGYRGDASEKVKLADKLKPLYEVIPDQRLRDLYLAEAAQKMSVTLPWLRQAVGLQSSGPVYSQNRPGISRTVQPSMQPQNANPTPPAAVSDSAEGGKISLKGASKAEVMLLGLVLKSRANFERFVNEKVLDYIAHTGVKKILEKASDVYRQDLNKFDKLTSLLVSYVDHPELLFVAEPTPDGDPGFDEEKEMKLLGDCFKRVRDNFLRDQAKQLAQELKSEPSSEKLEQIMKAHRDRLSLNKG